MAEIILPEGMMADAHSAVESSDVSPIQGTAKITFESGTAVVHIMAGNDTGVKMGQARLTNGKFPTDGSVEVQGDVQAPKFDELQGDYEVSMFNQSSMISEVGTVEIIFRRGSDFAAIFLGKLPDGYPEFEGEGQGSFMG